MKTRSMETTDRWGLRLIARFGQARLVARRDGRVELRGGSQAEQTEAKEWISLFLHDSVLRVTPTSATTASW